MVIKEPTLLVVHDKDEPWYFLVRDDTELAKACLKLLKVRMDVGWYYEPEPPKESDNPILSMTLEEISALPEPIRSEYEGKYDALKARVARDMSQYQSEKTWWNVVQSLLSKPVEEAAERRDKYGKPLAWTAVSWRRDYEYENVTLESFEDLD